jgi:hypothetical protein
LSLVICLLLIHSCKPVTKDNSSEVAPSTSVTSPYPSLSNEEITKLYSIAEKVDMIFYNLPMSVNQDDAASAKNTVLYISPAPAIIANHCKPLGRLSWISQGAIVKEADIYVDTGCQYMIFMKNNQPVAANAMSESGVEFFNQIMNQAQPQRK